MKINFVGDIGLFRKYEKRSIDPLREVSLPDADLHIGNFEFVVPGEAKPAFYDVQARYSCSFDYFRGLDLNRFQGYGLANNHSLDYGYGGLQETRSVLDDSGVTTFGFSDSADYSIGTFETGHVKVGIIACVKEGRWSKSVHGFGPDSYDPDRIESLIREMLPAFNHVIVYPHWGTELVEIPTEEDVKSARRFIDAGATAVIGHHPHISQGIEAYGGGVIAYSLGSFIYIPEEELGYSSNQQNRDISIAFRLELDRDQLLGFSAFYYRYNTDSLLPEPEDSEEITQYAQFLDRNIHNRELYYNQVKSGLLKRELRSFWIRFTNRPFRTLWNYLSLLRWSKIKKLLGT